MSSARPTFRLRSWRWLIVPVLTLEDRADSAARARHRTRINWFVWLAFCADYVGKLLMTPSRRDYARRQWFDLLIILLAPRFLVPDTLQGVRAVRVLRLLRFVRAAPSGCAKRHRVSHRKSLHVALA